MKRLLFAALLLACATPVALNLTDPDLWGHVRYGQEWIAEGLLPRTATHTFTAEGYRWINHENLAELLLALGFDHLGNRGMLGAKCLLGMSLIGLMALAAKRDRVPWPLAWGFFVLIAKNLEAFFPFRPQLLSFLFCALMLGALQLAFRRGEDAHGNSRTSIQWGWLLPLPVLIALWINSHGGVIAGLAILTVYLLGRSIEKAYDEGLRAGRSIAGLLAVLACSFLATLANPYGTELLAWYAESLGTARPEITEWGPPLPGNPVFVPFVTLTTLTVLVACFTRERRDPVHFLLLALVGWQSAEHLRHIAFFALLCGFWMPVHLASVLRRIQEAIPARPVSPLTSGVRASLVVALATCVALQTVALGHRLSSLPVYRSNYPVDAIRWMSDQEVRGKLIVNFNWAQYAIAALAPDVRVGFDGRFRTCYPQEVVDLHFDFLMGDLGPRSRSETSGPIDGTRLLEHGNPDYILIDRRYPHARGIMQEVAAEDLPEWSLLYQDALAQLWGRAALVDPPASPGFVATDDRIIANHYSETMVEWPAFAPSRSRSTAPVRASVLAQRSPSSNSPANGQLPSSASPSLPIAP